jgi:hypothetical protein
MTPAGEQAWRIARWAWDDPAGRAEDGLARITALARTSPDDKSVTDAGTMLSRLAGSLQGRSISDQMSGGPGS